MQTGAVLTNLESQERIRAKSCQKQLSRLFIQGERNERKSKREKLQSLVWQNTKTRRKWQLK